jgi:hypothetical protein
MITTIQLNETTKNILANLRESKETYEAVILRMIQIFEKQRRQLEELMIEGCKEMAEENLKITKEFEAIEDLDDWEWKENED